MESADVEDAGLRQVKPGLELASEVRVVVCTMVDIRSAVDARHLIQDIDE